MANDHCSEIRPLPTAEAAAASSEIPKRHAWELDDAAVSASANGLRITTLMELESWCSDDWPDCEYWRCLVMAAAVDLGGHAEDLINHRVALVYLRSRRSSLTDLFRHAEGYEGLKEAAEHADDVISDEINHFLFRQFQETHMPTVTRSVRRATKVIDEPETKRAVPETPGKDLDHQVETIRLDVGLLRDSPFQVRKPPGDGWLNEIADSLVQDGQLTNCLVRYMNNGEFYELIAGHTRTAAARLRGIKTLRCDVVECTDDVARRLVYLENAKRRDLDQLEKAETILKLWEEYQRTGRTQDDLARDLGMAQSTISNTMRLLQLTPALQGMLRDGHLNLDQARALARWGHRHEVQQKFVKLKDENGLREPGPIENRHFSGWLDRAVESCSRPMSKGTGWSSGPSCEFKPTKEEEEQLDIEKVKRQFGGEQRRAFNVKLWQKLNREAKARQAEKEKAKTTAKPKAESDGKNWGEINRQNRRKMLLIRAWNIATAAAIAERFAGKLNVVDRALLHRLTTIIGPSHYDIIQTKLDWKADDLALPEEAWTARCLENVSEFFAEDGNWDEMSDDELANFATVLGVDPGLQFLPTEELLDDLKFDEIRDLAALQCISGEEADLLPQLGEKWPKGWVPDLCRLDQPKKSRKGKK